VKLHNLKFNAIHLSDIKLLYVAYRHKSLTLWY